MTTQKVIGLWLDKTSDPKEPSWIVSSDEMNARGEAETTKTEDVFPADDYDNAREAAITLAKERECPVIETADNGQQECIYCPDGETAIVS